MVALCVHERLFRFCEPCLPYCVPTIFPSFSVSLHDEKSGQEIARRLPAVELGARQNARSVRFNTLEKTR